VIFREYMKSQLLGLDQSTILRLGAFPEFQELFQKKMVEEPQKWGKYKKLMKQSPKNPPPSPMDYTDPKDIDYDDEYFDI
jgi:hypothetical protein